MQCEHVCRADTVVIPYGLMQPHFRGNTITKVTHFRASSFLVLLLMMLAVSPFLGFISSSSVEPINTQPCLCSRCLRSEFSAQRQPLLNYDPLAGVVMPAILAWNTDFVSDGISSQNPTTHSMSSKCHLATTGRLVDSQEVRTDIRRIHKIAGIPSLTGGLQYLKKRGKKRHLCSPLSNRTLLFIILSFFAAIYERSCEAYRNTASPSDVFTIDPDGSGPLAHTDVNCTLSGRLLPTVFAETDLNVIFMYFQSCGVNQVVEQCLENSRISLTQFGLSLHLGVVQRAPLSLFTVRH